MLVYSKTLCLLSVGSHPACPKPAKYVDEYTSLFSHSALILTQCGMGFMLVENISIEKKMYKKKKPIFICTQWMAL